MMICGIINIIGNVFFLFIIDSFTTIGWIDRNGKYQSIHIDPGFLFLMALAKIIGGGYLSYVQGRKTVDVFKPVVKEYRDAQTGVTQGIPMTEKKSLSMWQLQGLYWKITSALIFIVLVSVLIMKNQFESKAMGYIHMKYAMKKLNDSTVDFSIDLAKTFGDSNYKFIDDADLDGYDDTWMDKYLPEDFDFEKENFGIDVPKNLSLKSIAK